MSYFKKPDLVTELAPKLYSITASSNPISATIKNSSFIEYKTNVKLTAGTVALITPTPRLHLKHLQMSPFVHYGGSAIKIPFKLCPEGYDNDSEGFPEDNTIYKQGDVIATVYILSE